MKRCVYSKACAVLLGEYDHPRLRGTVIFTQRCNGVIMEVRVTGLPETQTGFFALHIHEGGKCSGVGFAESGGHYDPDGFLHPSHAGDLPPLLADHGRAYMKVFTDRFSVDEIIGRTVVIHSRADDFHTQPSGNPGTKIACGVIQHS